jgi:hypothetical protein
LTVTVCPATATLALRASADVLAAMISVTEPLPLPLVGETVTQPALDAAAHEQPAMVVTVTVALSPPAAADIVAGDTV